MNFLDLLEYKVLTITNKLPEWLDPNACLLVIQENINYLNNSIEMIAESGEKSLFSLSYCKTVRRKIPLKEWYLSNEYKETGEHLLVGKLPWEHFVIMSPFRKEAEA